ncbi:36304_t:CDS:2 [Gigaspora margarita]|uniref:36304_t:CDS:1 n=1 Tax=Gigaspora margarita TaxID=4874 RepID=A0ABM8W442_GIGMA|nr:36304_t:CDS:2 [Gigaspora margarita]
MSTANSVAHGTFRKNELDLSKVHVPRGSPPLGRTKSLSFLIEQRRLQIFWNEIKLT